MLEHRLKLASLLVASYAFTALSVSAAQAGNRVALVIGNQDYGNAVGPLTHARDGAKLVGDALTRSRFEVSPHHDLTLQGMLDAIDAFARKLSTSAAGAGTDARLTSFVYFTGHGVSDANGINYLVPIRSLSLAAGELARTALPLSTLVEKLTAAAPQANHIIVVDACRTAVGNGGGGADTPAGYDAAKLAALPPGVFVTFATGFRKVAPDRLDFADALAGWVVRANVDHEVAFAKLSRDVFERTGKAQEPISVGHLHSAVRLGFDVGASGDSQRFDAVGQSAVMFVHDDVPAYSQTDASAGVVEVLGRGTLRTEGGGAPEIFRVHQEGTSDEWITYKTIWGRAYVRANLVSLR
ncbi:MAG: caspase domain-containing protein [Hyphomicrobiaceae bacterium]